jgi:hypothetical protein
VLINLLYFLIFILILTYFFFSKYVDFCETYIHYKDKDKKRKIDRLNDLKLIKKIEYDNNKNKTENFIIDVECEDITHDNNRQKIKGYLK